MGPLCARSRKMQPGGGLHRRHLTSSHRSAIAVDILPMLEQEAKERQGTRTDLDGTLLKNLSNVGTDRNEGMATAQAAAALGTRYGKHSAAQRT